MPVSERVFNKLKDNLACFADKLHDEKTYEYLQTVLKKAKTSLKSNESKVPYP